MRTAAPNRVSELLQSVSVRLMIFGIPRWLRPSPRSWRHSPPTEGGGSYHAALPQPVGHAQRGSSDVSATNGSERGRGLRLAIAAIASASLLVPLAALGGDGHGSSAAAEYQYQITICHHTHSATNPTVTIRVNVNALPAHQAHGDTVGPCP